MANIIYGPTIESLIYIMVYAKIDIVHAMGVVSRFMSKSGKAHWEIVKWILRCLQGTTKKYFYFRKGEIKVQGYIDANFISDVDHTKKYNQLHIYCWYLSS